MNKTLSNDLATRPAILEEARQMALSFLNQQNDMPAGKNVASLGPVELPNTGRGAIAVLQQFQEQFAHQLSNSAGPRYFGFVTGGSTPAALAGDWLVSAYDQNACGSNDSIAPQLEHQTIGFFKQLFGLDDTFFGSFVTGATMANFTGLAIGRQWIGEQQGLDFSQQGASDVVVLSGTPHSSVLKSLSMLGIGRGAMQHVSTLPEREAVDIHALEASLRALNGRPCLVVANAGTVNTVDFDDLEAIAGLKKKYSFWLHIDAAFGGFAACSPRFMSLTKGLDKADSLTVDAHKWLNVPYDAAMQFTRHKSLQLKVFQNSAAYLGNPDESPDFFHYTPENSRRFRALPSWFTLMAYGRDGYRDIVERNCDAAAYFGEQLKASASFELLAPVRMNVVCFTLASREGSAQAIKELLAAVRDDGRVFFTPTVYKGRPAMRAAVSNWLTERSDMDVALEALSTVHRELQAVRTI